MARKKSTKKYTRKDLQKAENDYKKYSAEWHNCEVKTGNISLKIEACERKLRELNTEYQRINKMSRTARANTYKAADRLNKIRPQFGLKTKTQENKEYTEKVIRELQECR